MSDATVITGTGDEVNAFEATNFDVTIGIDTDNAAFDNPSELARILRALADTIDGTPDVTDYDGLALRDVNGNTVGTVYVR